MLSDLTMKNDLQKVVPEEVLEKLNALHVFNFEWRGRKDDRAYGVIAQEVQPLFPDMVKFSKDGLMGVNYASLTALLLVAVQQLNKEIEEMKNAR